MEERRTTAKTSTKDTSHHLIMENRKKLSVSGVEDVVSFDEDAVSLDTVMGRLNIGGKNLHINKLSIDAGEVVVEGEVNSCAYAEVEDTRRSGGILRRMFQ